MNFAFLLSLRQLVLLLKLSLTSPCNWERFFCVGVPVLWMEDQYINHIMNETSANALLKGRGAGNVKDSHGEVSSLCIYTCPAIVPKVLKMQGAWMKIFWIRSVWSSVPPETYTLIKLLSLLISPAPTKTSPATITRQQSLGYEFGNDEFHAYVHGRLSRIQCC